MTFNGSRRYQAFGCLILASIPGVAKAQTAPVPTPPASAPPTAVEAPAASSGDNVGVGDIVVTAQRRSESMQRVPVAVTAIGGDTLASARIVSSEQIQILAPALVVNNTNGFPQPFIRGVGSDRALGSEPSVATYVDGIYISYAAAVSQQLYDVERVEVLRGPQGTLFGRNSTGGAISIITKSPPKSFVADGSVTAGNYGLLSGSGYIGGPLSSTLRASLAFSGSRQDSFNHNVSPRADQSSPERETATTVRGKLVWEPSSGFQAELSADAMKTYSFDAVAQRQVQPNATGVSLGGTVVTQPFDVAYGQPNFDRITQYGGSLKLKADLGFANLVSLTGYRDTKQLIAADLGAMDVLVQHLNIPTRSQQESQEIQLQSPSSSPVTWILGGYYFHENLSFSPYSILVNPALPINPKNYFFDIHQRTNSYSVFGQATVPIYKGLSIVAGLRQSWEKKVVPDVVFTNLGTTPATTTIPGKTSNVSKLTYKFGINYQASSAMLFYASVSKGFKSGLFNLAGPTALGPLKPEVLMAYEAGAKLDLFDRKLRVNLSAYHYDYSNLVVNVVGTVNGIGTSVLLNAASARMNGGEIEISAAPMRGLRLSASAAILDGKYKSFPNAPVLSPRPAPGYGNATSSVNASGTDTIRSPRFAGTLDASYEFEIGSLGSLTLSATGYHNSGYKFDAAGLTRQPSYNLLNTSVTFTAPNKAWNLSIWGKNVTNTVYYATRALTGFGQYVKNGDPATVGATLTIHFAGAR